MPQSAAISFKYSEKGMCFLYLTQNLATHICSFRRNSNFFKQCSCIKSELQVRLLMWLIWSEKVFGRLHIHEVLKKCLVTSVYKSKSLHWNCNSTFLIAKTTSTCPCVKLLVFIIALLELGQPTHLCSEHVLMAHNFFLGNYTVVSWK